MLGPYPTWFEFRKRGSLYFIMVRNTWYPNWQNRDVKEDKHLADIHDLLTSRCHTQIFKKFFGIEYAAYAVPYYWRFPFLSWLTDLVGPGADPDPSRIICSDYKSIKNYNITIPTLPSFHIELPHF